MTALFLLIQYPDSSLLPRLSDGRVFEDLAYTEQGENHETMILDGVCYSAIRFGRVILYVWRSPFINSIFLVLSDKSLVPVLLSLGVYRRLCFPFDATLILISPLHHLPQNSQSFPLARMF